MPKEIQFLDNLRNFSKQTCSNKKNKLSAFEDDQEEKKQL